MMHLVHSTLHSALFIVHPYYIYVFIYYPHIYTIYSEHLA